MFTRGYGGADHCFWFFSRYLSGGWGTLMLVAVVLAAIVLSILVVKKSNKKDTSKEALERLKIRYVNGELSEEEYLQKKKVLEM